jgi:glutamine synthetase type III
MFDYFFDCFAFVPILIYLLSYFSQVIFNGNGYDLDEQDKLTAAGCWRYDNGIDATCRLSEPKNLALFEEMRVLTSAECLAREDVMLMQYVGTVEIEVWMMQCVFLIVCCRQSYPQFFNIKIS